MKALADYLFRRLSLPQPEPVAAPGFLASIWICCLGSGSSRYRSWSIIYFASVGFYETKKATISNAYWRAGLQPDRAYLRI